MAIEASATARYHTPLRAAQREQMRHRILTAAREQFHIRHYDVTTMDEIAVAAGIRRSTLYLHFRDKAEILLALIADYGGKAGAVLATLPAPGASLSEVRGWVDEIARFIAGERVPLSIIVEVRRRQAFTEALDQLTNELLAALGSNNPRLAGAADPAGDPARRARGLMLLQELMYACESHIEDPGSACGQALLDIAAADFHAVVSNPGIN
jgi:AcrR family transcriptional regulator